ncbi:MAG: aminotransferase class V-fold PLP-dependent enzyme [Oscillatoriales cyanobacterium]|nr:MAG: aminotransferase class V-fold PLP-dependent enzyme [Oscillatoriales cyanobacterium]
MSDSIESQPSSHLETVAIHAGRAVDPATGAIAPPLYLTTTFERSPDGSYPQGYLYGRLDHPNRRSLETCLAALEGGAAAAAFSSGAAAMMACLQAIGPGRIVAPLDLYRGTAQLMEQVLQPWGLAVDWVDATDLDQVAAALTPDTKAIWVETPSNPLLKLADIAAIAQLAHRVGALCICDNTWATPILQQPIALGADWVVHSTTKYLGGHSDVSGGAVIAARQDAAFDRLRQVQRLGGSGMTPFDCWLTLRSVATLPVRMAAHCAGGRRVADWLRSHPAVEAVHYPSLADHPQAALARSQMRDFGGMVSVQVRGGQTEAMAVVAALQLWTRATSLGGVESLIEHRASIEGPGTHTPNNLLRLSVGLEHGDDLVADLAQALDRVYGL